MSQFSLLRLSFLLLLAVLAARGSAHAEPSLADAIKQADAKYLGVPDIATEDSTPKIEAGGGEEDATPVPRARRGARGAQLPRGET